MKLPARALELLLLPLLMLTGCGSDGEWRAPYESRVAVPGTRLTAIKGRTYVVQPGDTLSSIAMRSGISAHKISDWNGIKTPDHLQVGQRLRLRMPRKEETQAAAGLNTTPVKKPAAKPRAAGSRQPKQRQRAARQSDAGKSRQKQPQQTGQAEQIKQSVMAKMEESSRRHSFLPDSKLRWVWPVKGRVIRRYQPSDPARRGILISGAEGKKISATESGEVVYSDNGLTGYGELIIVKHNKNYMSVYAHNRKRLVKKGEWVSRGAQIATMGRSSGKAVLHFEIRHNGEAQNPRDYLP